MENELPDFEYVPRMVRFPDGSIRPVFRMVDLPKGEEGVVARHLKDHPSLDTRIVIGHRKSKNKKLT